MTLPAFATLDEFRDRLPDGIADGDEARAQAALDDASALIRSAAGKTWTSTVDDRVVLDADVPDIVGTVCIAAARRAFSNPAGLRETITGPFRSFYGDSSLDVYLKASEKQMVRQAGGRTGVATLSTTREDPKTLSDVGVVDDRGTVYVDVDGGDMMPWILSDDVT